MAPELLASSDRQPPADIFSLGLTLYEVCVLSEHRARVGAGMSPLSAEGPAWHLFRNGTIPVLSNRSDALYALIKSALTVTASDRPTAESILSLPNVISAKSDTEALLNLATLHSISSHRGCSSPCVLPVNAPCHQASYPGESRLFWPYELRVSANEMDIINQQEL